MLKHKTYRDCPTRNRPETIAVPRRFPEIETHALRLDARIAVYRP